MQMSCKLWQFAGHFVACIASHVLPAPAAPPAPPPAAPQVSASSTTSQHALCVATNVHDFAEVLVGVYAFESWIVAII